MRRLLLLPVLALALTACAADPEATLRGDVEDVVLAANSNDADGVRDAVDDLLSTIREQVGSGELPPQRGRELRELALAVQASAGALDPEPSPEPSPSTEPSPSEEPSPSPEPSPSEEPSPSPEPSPSEEPSPEPSPEESDEPSITDPLSPSPAAAQSSPAAAQSSPAAASPSASAVQG